MVKEKIVKFHLYTLRNKSGLRQENGGPITIIDSNVKNAPEVYHGEAFIKAFPSPEMVRKE